MSLYFYNTNTYEVKVGKLLYIKKLHGRSASDDGFETPVYDLCIEHSWSGPHSIEEIRKRLIEQRTHLDKAITEIDQEFFPKSLKRHE